MNKNKGLIIGTLLFILIFFIVPMSVTIWIYDASFGDRVKSISTEFYEYILEYEPEFERHRQEIEGSKNNLVGYFYIYPDMDYKGTIVISHGMGNTHDEYMAEAEYMARNGYVVFAYDNTGTGQSGGKSPKGLSQAPIDLNDVLNHLARIDELSSMPIMLYGHSWGGYAVTSVHQLTPGIKIDGIVSVSGFDKNTNVMRQHGRKVVGSLADVLLPYARLYEKILFGPVSDISGTTGLYYYNGSAMFIHSEDDTVVDYADNFLSFKTLYDFEPTYQFISYKDKGHNVLLGTDLNDRANEIEDMLDVMEPGTGEYESLQNELFDIYVQIDPSVMDRIIEYFDNTVAISLAEKAS